MKRLLLLLIVVASAISVSAQKDYRDRDRNERDRYHYKHDGNRKQVYKYKRNRVELKRQVAAINRTFDDRVRSIQRNPFMSRNQKSRKIHELEMHRRVALNECRDRFIGRRGRS